MDLSEAEKAQFTNVFESPDIAVRETAKIFVYENDSLGCIRSTIYYEELVKGIFVNLKITKTRNYFRNKEILVITDRGDTTFSFTGDFIRGDNPLSKSEHTLRYGSKIEVIGKMALVGPIYYIVEKSISNSDQWTPILCKFSPYYGNLYYEPSKFQLFIEEEIFKESSEDTQFRLIVTTVNYTLIKQWAQVLLSFKVKPMDKLTLFENFVNKNKPTAEGGIKKLSLNDYNVDLNIPISNTTNRDAVGVTIGNENYKNELIPKVEYATNDASIMKEHLIKTLGYREENIIYVSNASQAEFNSIFGTDKDHHGKLYSWIRPSVSDVFIYYSGHGAPNIETRKGYFVPVDCDPTLVALNGYSLDTFYTNLSKIPYKSLTVVIDACFSGTSEGGSLLQNISPVFASINNPAMVKKNTVIFTSAKGNQVSSWYPAMKHSLFTYYFLKGLHGMADKNKDKRLMVSELGKYLMENIPYAARRLNNREQTPQIIGDIERVIVRY